MIVEKYSSIHRIVIPGPQSGTRNPVEYLSEMRMLRSRKSSIFGECFLAALVAPHPNPPPRGGEGVDYCYRGKSLLLKLPRELNSFSQSCHCERPQGAKQSPSEKMRLLCRRYAASRNDNRISVFIPAESQGTGFPPSTPLEWSHAGMTVRRYPTIFQQPFIGFPKSASCRCWNGG